MTARKRTRRVEGVALTPEEWARLSKCLSALHNVLHRCFGLNDEQRVEPILPIYAEMSRTPSPVRKRLGGAIHGREGDHEEV